ncbi:acetyltransferase [Vibrio sp. 10N.261.51.A3]|uniref:acetyltransferase n=1 Tax=Vibrio sp. 10N.261.51.A3 TaxID=3229673 RepID=UPI0035538BF1
MAAYLIGAGGFAREIYSYLDSIGFDKLGHDFGGFLSDFSNDLDNFNYKSGVVGPIKNSCITKNDVLIMAIADPQFKQQLYEYYNHRNVTFMTFIHPTAVIGKNVKIGIGSVICPNVTITTDVAIGKLSTLNAHSSIGHDVLLHDYCTLSGHCDVTGFVELGSRVFMGSHALVIPKVKVGDDVVIGAGSVVVSKVKSGSTVFGNPAKKIK